MRRRHGPVLLDCLLRARRFDIFEKSIRGDVCPRRVARIASRGAAGAVACVCEAKEVDT
jgi:hypothetical protein